MAKASDPPTERRLHLRQIEEELWSVALHAYCSLARRCTTSHTATLPTQLCARVPNRGCYPPGFSATVVSHGTGRAGLDRLCQPGFN